MLSKLIGRMTFANVISVVALFIAIGGSAYAAGLAKNSVGSKQLKAKGVKNGDLADNVVTSPKVANGSLLGEDFAAGQLPTGAGGSETGPVGPRGAQGVAGQTGDQGDVGPQGVAGQTGDPGALGVSGYERVQVSSLSNADHAKSITASCPPGKEVLGGGAYLAGVFPSWENVALDSSSPDDSNGWYASAHEHTPTADAWILTAFVFCANVQ